MSLVVSSFIYNTFIVNGMIESLNATKLTLPIAVALLLLQENIVMNKFFKSNFYVDLKGCASFGASNL